MADNDNKRYYWLKLKKDFFKRHDIRIIEGMPNGKDYVLFYLKLMCESTSHNGELRFSEYIPYSEEMLATITNTNVDVVRQAIKIFVDLKMMEILDDGTIYLNEVEKMIGSETGKAIRMKEYRNKQKLLNCSNEPKCSLEIEKEKEIDKDKEIDKSKNKKFVPPTLDEINKYIQEKQLNVDGNKFYNFFTEGNWVDTRGNKVKNWKQKLLTWGNYSNNKNRVSIEPIPIYEDMP